jgi:hypothetical protein
MKGYRITRHDGLCGIVFDHLKLKALCPLPATGRFRHRFVSSCLHFAPLYTFRDLYFEVFGFSSDFFWKNVINDFHPKWEVDGQELPLIAPADGTKYLGVKVNNWTGVPKKTLGKSSYSLVHFQQFALRGFDLGQIEL